MKELTKKDAWRKLELALKKNEQLKAQVEKLKEDCRYFLSKIPVTGGKNEI